jgi:2-amino-4-hydroxy-6-hydroxymethyldihydropteridine diphosphokinase
MNCAVVSIGSNIEPRKNIPYAIDILSSRHTVLAVSSLIQTKPIGFTKQPDFANGCILISTVLSIEQFVSCLKEIELQLRRRKTANKSGPRTIDLDIIIWNNQIVDNDFYKRDFLRELILQILPQTGL